MSSIPVRALAAEVRMLLVDVDGVLTDGTLYYGAEGETLKAFHVRDGLGIRLLLHEGIEVAAISARKTPVLEQRIRDLRIAHAFFGRDDKEAALEEIVDTLRIPEGEIAYIGDDILDLPVMRRVGLPIAVNDAHRFVLEEAAWVTLLPGGKGAVREVADGLLEARGRLVEACESLLREGLGQGDLTTA